MRPLIEQGSQILQEANGVIRGLDPDGRIQGKAKGKAASREATPEEYRLADVLKEVSFHNQTPPPFETGELMQVNAVDGKCCPNHREIKEEDCRNATCEEGVESFVGFAGR